jgi:hypothetical protein
MSSASPKHRRRTGSCPVRGPAVGVLPRPDAVGGATRGQPQSSGRLSRRRPSASRRPPATTSPARPPPSPARPGSLDAFTESARVAMALPLPQRGSAASTARGRASCDRPERAPRDHLRRRGIRTTIPVPAGRGPRAAGVTATIPGSALRVRLTDAHRCPKATPPRRRACSHSAVPVGRLHGSAPDNAVTPPASRNIHGCARCVLQFSRATRHPCRARDRWAEFFRMPKVRRVLGALCRK